MLPTLTMAVTSLFMFGTQANAVENGDDQAFFQGRDAFVELQAEPPASDASVRWAVSLKALAQSKSPAKARTSPAPPTSCNAGLLVLSVLLVALNIPAPRQNERSATPP